MNIDLTLLHNNTIDKLDITNTYDIPKDYINDLSVLEVNNIKVEGSIYQKEKAEINNLDDYINCTIKGKIKVQDSITLEPIDLDIDTKIDEFIEENYKKNENTLDILLLLWENIVLEVPLQFTRVNDLSKFHGDGWKLISEEELKHSNNPFSDLLKDFDNKE